MKCSLLVFVISLLPYIDYFQISGIVGGNFDLGKIDTYIHLREDNGVEPFHQFGLELDVMEVRFDYMSTSVLMGRVSHLLLKVSTYTYSYNSRCNIVSWLTWVYWQFLNKESWDYLIFIYLVHIHLLIVHKYLHNNTASENLCSDTI